MMTTITTTAATTTTGSDLRFSPSPPSLDVAVVPEKPRQKPRKKRTKLIRIDDTSTGSSTGGVGKPKYSKKPDPGAPKITRPCSECGKKFWSWKALFGHMRCHPERQWRGINPPPNLRRPGSPPVAVPLAVMAPVVSEEDQEIASCLLMLASGVERANERSIIDAEFDGFFRESVAAVEMVGPPGMGCRFECSSCKKVFGSHQALGGHRASHKNVKGCFAITRSSASDGDEFDNVQDQSIVGHGDNERDIGAALEEEKMLMVLGGHKCSICLRVFSSGQALGGHKRCHWEKGEEGVTTCGLDLNMPAPMEDGSSSSYTSTSGLTLDLRLGL